MSLPSSGALTMPLLLRPLSFREQRNPLFEETKSKVVNNIIPRNSPLIGKLFNVNLKARFQIKKHEHDLIKIRRSGIIGAGIMGDGIAYQNAIKG